LFIATEQAEEHKCSHRQQERTTKQIDRPASLRFWADGCFWWLYNLLGLFILL
jgi:hypothetical protein